MRYSTIDRDVDLLGHGRVEMIDATYGHLAPDADEYELALLDAFDTRELPSDGHVLGTDG